MKFGNRADRCLGLVLTMATTIAILHYCGRVVATDVDPTLRTAEMAVTVRGDAARFDVGHNREFYLRFLSLSADGQSQGMYATRTASNESQIDQAYGNSVIYWFRAVHSSIEQGFTLSHSIGNAITFSWAVSGNLTPSLHDNGLLFSDGHVSVVKEDAIQVYDRNHRLFPTILDYSHGVLSLSVDLTGAAYPVVVDPTFSLVGRFSTPAELVPGFGVPTWYAGGDSAIALSKDGHTTIIGDRSWMYLNSSTSDANGRAYIFSDSGGSWDQVTTLNDPDGFNIVSTDQFGTAAAIDAAGTTVVIGSQGNPPDGYPPGKVFIYQLVGGSWQPPQQIHNPNSNFGHNDDSFGNSVAISDDGNTILVSASSSTIYGALGNVYVYGNVGGNWQPEANILNPTGTSAGAFGAPVVLAGNGTAAAIVGNGKVYLFTLTSGVWTESHEFDNPNPFGGTFGVSLGIADDGNTLIIPAVVGGVNGGPDNDVTYIYENQSGTWTLAASIADPDGSDLDGWGQKVALSGDGATAAIGSRAATTQFSGQCGKTYVYARSGNAWSLQQEIDNPTAGKIAENLNDPAVPATLDFGYVGIGLSRDGQVALIGSGGDLNAIDDYSTITSGFNYVYSLKAQSPPAPTISGGTDQTLTVGVTPSTETMTLTGTQPLAVTVFTDNTVLLPLSAINMNSDCGTGSLICSVSLAPSANQTGTATATVIVQDVLGQYATKTMSLTVNTSSNSGSVSTGGNGSANTGGSGNGSGVTSAPAKSGGGGGEGLLELLALLVLSRRQRRNKWQSIDDMP